MDHWAANSLLRPLHLSCPPSLLSTLCRHTDFFLPLCEDTVLLGEPLHLMPLLPGRLCGTSWHSCVLVIPTSGRGGHGGVSQIMRACKTIKTMAIVLLLYYFTDLVSVSFPPVPAPTQQRREPGSFGGVSQGCACTGNEGMFPEEMKRSCLCQLPPVWP